MRRPRKSAWLIVSLTAVGLFGLAAGGLWLALNARLPAQELVAAQKRWAARSFSNYRLSIELRSDTGFVCKQDSAIANETIVATFQNTCPRTPRTITALFAEIKALAAMRRCRGGCACDGEVLVYADYDKQLGYPKEFTARLWPEARWLSLTTWQRLWSGGGCYVAGFVGETIRVLSLAPASPQP